MTDIEKLGNRRRIGAMLAGIRKNRGLTQEDLARLSGLDRANIAKIENGRYSVGLDVLYKLCNSLGVEIKFE